MPVQIHGKEYLTVAERVADFRTKHADWTIESDLISNDDAVIVKTSILNESGRLLASGFAEEIRGSTMINSSSALENCETSAVGRALSFLGFGGTEIASADEVANAIKQQQIEGMSLAEAKDILEEHQYPEFFFNCYQNNKPEETIEAIAELTKLETRAVKKLMQGAYEEEYKAFMREAFKAYNKQKREEAKNEDRD
jgi:hypothetical protein